MFNLLIKGSSWANTRDTMLVSRAFEHTAPALVARFQPDGQTAFAELFTLPALFVEEKSGTGAEQVVRVGSISRARQSGRDILLDYAYDSTVPPFSNEQLNDISVDLDIDQWELSRTHWAIKDVDLFRVLFRELRPRRQDPKVFRVADPQRIEATLISAMMPFHPSFDAVYGSLKTIAATAGLRCRRADDIWESPAVIQDVVSLIDRSTVVICDCTGRNPNVFYETGIAHSLGREVILITQVESDIPFDLRHLRYVHYLNNGEGLRALESKLARRIADLVAAP